MGQKQCTRLERFCTESERSHIRCRPLARENQNESDLIGGVNIATVNKQVATVLVDMTSTWTIGYSLGLGAAVLDELRSINRLHKGKVEQAASRCLKGKASPPFW